MPELQWEVLCCTIRVIRRSRTDSAPRDILLCVTIQSILDLFRNILALYEIMQHSSGKGYLLKSEIA
jgi:hypothetical protein